LPRRLGDDPLIRAKAAQGPATGASASGDPQPAVQSSPRSSYNDVFFQRRAEGTSPAIVGKSQQASEAAIANERAEISEISEIPEIREMAAAPVVRADSVVAPIEMKVAPQATESAEVGAVAAVVTVESASPNESGSPIQASASHAEAAAKDAPTSQGEEKSGGFLKRLFGRFGK
jgi:hypothetical protein